MEMIPLKVWAIAKGLNLQTAQRYVREGRIVPTPVREGHAWMVAPDAAVVVQTIHWPHKLVRD